MAAPTTAASTRRVFAHTLRAGEHTLPHDDPERMGELLCSLEPRLLAVARRVTRDPDAARDVVQSAFEKALLHAGRFRGAARPSTWLHRIVVNEALMWLRGERRRASRLVELDAARTEALADPSPGVAELLARREEAARLRAGLSTLRPEEREVLEHCALEGRRYSELARRTGAHPAALKSRAFRARRHLSLILGSP